jgi:hypothetical protein
MQPLGDADLIAAETFPQREKSEKRAIMAFNQRFLWCTAESGF